MIFRVFKVFEYAAYAFFLYKQHFYKQHQAEIDKKKWAKAKQHPEAELLLFEIYLLSSATLSSTNNRAYSKNVQKSKCVYLSILMRL